MSRMIPEFSTRTGDEDGDGGNAPSLPAAKQYTSVNIIDRSHYIKSPYHPHPIREWIGPLDPPDWKWNGSKRKARTIAPRHAPKNAGAFSKLCGDCFSMFGTLEGLLALGTTVYQHSALEQRQSTKRGCQPCKILRKRCGKGSRELNISAQYQRLSGESAPKDYINGYPLWVTGSKCITVMFVGGTGRMVGFELSIYSSRDEDFRLCCGPIYRHMTDSGLLNLTQHTLKNCLENHSECFSFASPFMPTRVIDVGLNKSEQSLLRLYTSTPGEKGAYIALSYCWGGPQSFCTTADNLVRMTQGFALAALPRTLQDAINVTRNLGIKFLWVDALCIIQDSAADKAVEINNMGHTYRNATLVLVAENASHVEEGFLRKISIGDGLPLPFVLPSKEVTEVILFDHKTTEDELAPLQQRAWSFQESALASRLLTFEAHRLTWRCHKYANKPIFPHHIGSRCSTAPDLTKLINTIHSSGELRDAWRLVANDYSRRNITYLEDRLPAIAGVAALLQTSEYQYIAGIWNQPSAGHKNLLFELLDWEVSSPHGKPAMYIAPSWSWLSVNNQIKFTPIVDSREFIAKAELIACTAVAFDEAAPLARVQSGVLQLRAKLLPGTQFPATEADHEGRFRQDGYDVYSEHFDYIDEQHKDECLHFIQIGMEMDFDATVGLILTRVNEDEFQRVGMFRSYEQLNHMWEGAGTTLVKII
ncbi:uncharacterized protein BP5553_10545 [Venustampulla echinocandica]|uniref:Heterokaryon incompatibility domain-containing protein n=1 Tax=Venustampulla echinocandica TaxID=2656787 RepID=A0A370T8V3_9HELO|nr:uncharacterized protein BP5553_10545 [Venustampulla echinocandica]RDL29918.1 hypothetical protein BP5553_10545 [Venustampulla echinocandica]